MTAVPAAAQGSAGQSPGATRNGSGMLVRKLTVLIAAIAGAITLPFTSAAASAHGTASHNIIQYGYTMDKFATADQALMLRVVLGRMEPRRDSMCLTAFPAWPGLGRACPEGPGCCSTLRGGQLRR
jgi:hypothetical protein